MKMFNKSALVLGLMAGVSAVAQVTTFTGVLTATMAGGSAVTGNYAVSYNPATQVFTVAGTGTSSAAGSTLPIVVPSVTGINVTGSTSVSVAANGPQFTLFLAGGVVGAAQNFTWSATGNAAPGSSVTIQLIGPAGALSGGGGSGIGSGIGGPGGSGGGTGVLATNTFTAVPEPETYAAAAALGLVGFGLWRRRSA